MCPSSASVLLLPPFSFFCRLFHRSVHMAPHPPPSALYRTVLLACRAAFRNDAPTYAASKLEVRAQFLAKGHTPLPPHEYERAAADAHEAASFLKTMVVQAPLNPESNAYELRLEPHHANARGNIKPTLAEDVVDEDYDCEGCTTSSSTSTASSTSATTKE